MNTRRPYSMRTRADSAAATRARILEAATELMRQQFRPQVRLEVVAAEAGVTVQTVLRIFGSKAGLLDEVASQAVADVATEFAGVRPDDVDGAVRAYVNHYEKAGDLVVRNIQDENDPDIHAFVQRGRKAQRQGIEGGFPGYLEPLTPSARRRTVDALVVALDVYTWKRLRRDLGRSRRETEIIMHSLVTAILEAAT